MFVGRRVLLLGKLGSQSVSTKLGLRVGYALIDFLAIILRLIGNE